MDKNAGARFLLGVSGGIILGALIDEMWLGIAIGFAVGFGLFKWPFR